MTPLRKKLIDELTLSGFAPRTQKNYLRYVVDLARFHKRSPEQISPEEVRSYLALKVREKKASLSTVRVIGNALSFFYQRVLHTQLLLEDIRPKKPIRNPTIFSVQEIERILTWEKLSHRYRVFFITAYATGLRVGEVCHLKVEDLLADRNQIRVRQGKGRKDRYTVLFPKLLEELRDYWRLYRPCLWLFPRSTDPRLCLHPRSAQAAFLRAKTGVGLAHRGGLHCLRHSFATHMLEAGVPLNTLQGWLGHARLTTTAHYLHFVQPDVDSIRSPLELIDLSQIK